MNKVSTNWTAAIALVALILLFGLGWTILAKTQSKTIEVEQSTIPVESKISEDGCKNSQLGIEFTYIPEGWECKPNEYGINFIHEDGAYITVSMPDRGHPCDGSPEERLQCKASPFYENDAVELSLYTRERGYYEIYGRIKVEVLDSYYGRQASPYASAAGKYNYSTNSPDPLSPEQQDQIKEIFDSLILAK